LVKSFSETHPDAGVASGPVEVQRYVDGRGQVPPVGDVDGDGDGDGEGDVLGDCVGEGLGVPGLPVQATPFRENEAGTGVEPFEEPLNPKLVLPPLGMSAL